MQPARKRQRASHACDFCRAKKTRCDGNRPCEACYILEQECTFGSEANSRGKSDLILESVLRVEQALVELNQNFGSASTRQHRDATLSATSFDTPFNQFSSSVQENTTGVENAVLDSMHTSTTEAILQWPHFDELPALRKGYVSIFQLEHERGPWKVASTSMQPYVGPEEVDDILSAFQQNVNFWYPTVSVDQLTAVRKSVGSESMHMDTVDTCLALLVLALGCASQVTSGLATASSLDEIDSEKRGARRKLANMYFSSALKKIYIAHMEVNSKAAQCLLLTTLYFASLTHPLQAREYLSATCSKSLLLVSYPPQNEEGEGQERIRRIFWSCYILESDYLAELSACPTSGISRVESSVALPQTYRSHETREIEEQASLYFLACISMRRLLNRVHQLLYAQETGAARDHTKFPYVVAELDHQLDEWRDVLPSGLSFNLDIFPASNEAAAFLRQRYLTCRSVIYRPYLMWLLASPSWDEVHGEDVLANCQVCLDSCITHILNLRSFSHTVLIDSWICSLSMAGAMLILLAACRVSELRPLLRRDICKAGDHLRSVLGFWALLLPTDSPSVAQSIQLIEHAEDGIKQTATETGMLRSSVPP